MMKKLFCLLLAVVLVLALSACGGKDDTCKAEGCDEKAVEDGYCATHYALHAAGQLVDGIVNGDVDADDLDQMLGDALNGLGDLFG